MNVNIYYKREYGRISYFGLRKNKAKQTQFQNSAPKGSAGKIVGEKKKK